MTPDTTSDAPHDTPEESPAFVVTITEAARLLGMSVRTVQRRLDAGEWESVSVAGKRCVRLPANELPEGVTPDATSDIVDSVALNSTHDAPRDNQRDSGRAIVPVQRQTEVLAALANAIADAQAARHSSVQDVAAKVLLTIDECRLLTGLSREILRTAINDGNLQAVKIGRSWRIHRDDLNDYTRALVPRR